MTPERIKQFTDQLPKTPTFNGTDHVIAARALFSLLLELGINPTDQRSIAMNLARICTK